MAALDATESIIIDSTFIWHLVEPKVISSFGGYQR